MLSKEDYLMIRDMARRGAFQKDIATELGIHPKTVSRALRRSGAPSGKRPGVAMVGDSAPGDAVNGVSQVRDGLLLVKNEP